MGLLAGRPLGHLADWAMGRLPIRAAGHLGRSEMFGDSWESLEKFGDVWKRMAMFGNGKKCLETLGIIGNVRKPANCPITRLTNCIKGQLGSWPRGPSANCPIAQAASRPSGRLANGAIGQLPNRATGELGTTAIGQLGNVRQLLGITGHVWEPANCPGAQSAG